MAEERAKPKGKLLGKLMAFGGIAVVSAGVALGVFFVVIAPMFKEPATEAPKEGDTGKLPATFAIMEFKTLRASVLPSQQGGAPSLLQYSVAIVCRNDETRLLVEEKIQLFQAILVKLHDARNATDFTDAVVKESILRQAKSEMNAKLKSLEEKENPEIEILDVMYTEFTLVEL